MLGYYSFAIDYWLNDIITFFSIPELVKIPDNKFSTIRYKNVKRKFSLPLNSSYSDSH